MTKNNTSNVVNLRPLREQVEKELMMALASRAQADEVVARARAMIHFMDIAQANNTGPKPVPTAARLEQEKVGSTD